MLLARYPLGSHPEELGLSISRPLHPQTSGHPADMPGQPLWVKSG